MSFGGSQASNQMTLETFINSNGDRNMMPTADTTAQFQFTDGNDLKSMIMQLGENLSGQITGVTTQLSSIRTEIITVNDKVAKCQSLVANIEGRVATVIAENQVLKNDNDNLYSKLTQLERSVQYLENDKRNHNAIITGMNEKPDENVEKEVRELMKNELGCENVKLEVVYRMKGGITGKRPIMVKFLSESEKRTMINNARKKFADRGPVRIKNDIPKDWRTARSKLTKVWTQAKSENREVKVVKDHLVINNIAWRYNPDDDSIYQSPIADIGKK